MNDEHNMRNVVNLGDALKPGLAILERLARESEVFCKSVREQVEKEGIVGHCLDHESSQLEVDWERTFGMTRKNGSLTVEFLDCPVCGESKKETKKRVKWMTMGIPRSLTKCTFENFDTSEPSREEKLRVVRRFRHQCEKENGFIIACGEYGVGKSHLAASTIQFFGTGIFITEHDLIGELRQTYADNTGPDTMVQKYKMAKVLVLDDLSLDVKGVDIAPLLYRVLGYRYDNELLTVITSNETVDEVFTILGLRLMDRVKENYQVANFTWDSYRKRT